MPLMPHPFRGFQSLGLRMVLCFWAVTAYAVMGVAAQPDAPTITSIGQFWARNSEERARPSPFRIECEVTYYDPFWKILFIKDAKGEGAFIPSSDKLGHPFEFGQNLVVTGQFLPPGDEVRFDHAVIQKSGQSVPTPLPITEGINDSLRFLNTLVSVEGLVDHYSRIDDHHVGITLSTLGTTVLVTVLADPQTEIPNLTETELRIEGIYNPRRSSDGRMTGLEVLVQGFKNLTVLNRLDDDARFKSPVVSIGSLPSQSPDRLVHVRGQVKAQEAGRLLRIRDSSGEVDVLSGQTRLFEIDAAVEAVGYPFVTGTELRLKSGTYKTVAGPALPAADSASARTIRLAAQVLDLPPDEAEQGRTVRLTGVVTWRSGSGRFFFVQDSTSGVLVMKGSSNLADNYPGRNVKVTGVTGMGDYTPIVIASDCEILGELALPEAKPITLEHASTGAAQDSWVEMSGYLRRVRTEGDLNYLEMVTASGEYTAVLSCEQDVTSLVGGTIRMHGVCTAETDGKRKLTGIKLWVPSREFLIVEEAPRTDTFVLPAASLARLGQYNKAQLFDRLMRFSGVVLHQSIGYSIQIEDGGQSLRVFSQSTEPLKPGDQVDVVGFLAWQGGRVTLREAIYRKTGHRDQPRPVELTRNVAPAAAYDGHLVTVEATLIDASVAADRYRLTLQREKTVFEAFLNLSGPNGTRAEYTPGSSLSLTGVYEAIYDGIGDVSSFRVNLRGPEDIAVLRRPSWLTRQRIMAVSGALAVAVLLFVAWVAVLRHQVRRQTEQIREQVEQQARLKADLQRVNKLESLGLLAGGIAHDFNNLLTAIIGNLDLVRHGQAMNPESDESLREAEKAASRAKDLTFQLLTFAKGGAPVQAAVLLPEVVREVAEFALRGSNARCQFDIPEGLWPANVDRGQIGQVVQNIVINARQAMPKGGVVDVSIRNEDIDEKSGQLLAPGRYLCLSFTDHGEGIPSENIERIFDPYFTTKKGGVGLGLATAHSIIKKHLGHISVESAPGKGTTFRIWLPAASDDALAGVARDPAAASRVEIKDARILFLDDEQAIRRLGDTILSRLGYRVSVVSNGDEAVREYTQGLVSGRPYSAVILDLTIPGGRGGTQVLEELRQVDPGVRAIVSSGYSNDAVLANYQAHGFRGRLAKPFGPAEIAQAVARVLQDGQR